MLAVLAHAKDGLFPEPREMTLECSRQDSAEACKHVAAVLYGAELLSSATAGAVSRRHPAAGKRIADDRLSAVFGIELEAAPRRPPGVSNRRR